MSLDATGRKLFRNWGREILFFLKLIRLILQKKSNSNWIDTYSFIFFLPFHFTFCFDFSSLFGHIWFLPRWGLEEEYTIIILPLWFLWMIVETQFV